MRAFLLSLAVQYNDPDPHVLDVDLWARRRARGDGRGGPPLFRANAAALLLYLALFALWAPSLFGARPEAFEHWRMQASGDEEAREAGGLALCALWSAVQTLMARRR